MQGVNSKNKRRICGGESERGPMRIDVRRPLSLSSLFGLRWTSVILIHWLHWSSPAHLRRGSISVANTAKAPCWAARANEVPKMIQLVNSHDGEKKWMHHFKMGLKMSSIHSDATFLKITTRNVGSNWCYVLKKLNILTNIGWCQLVKVLLRKQNTFTGVFYPPPTTNKNGRRIAMSSHCSKMRLFYQDMGTDILS